MEPINFNPSRKITVDNDTDYGGNVVETLGMDFRKATSVDSLKGDFAVGAKMFPHTTDDDTGGTGLIEGFVESDCDSVGTYPNPTKRNIFALGATSVLKTPTLASKFDVDSDTDAPATTLAGEIEVFGKSLGYQAGQSGTGTLSTAGTAPSNQIINSGGTMVGVDYDAKINVTPAPPVTGLGRIYTAENGGSTTLKIDGGTFSDLDVGSELKGFNPANPTTTIDVLVTYLIDVHTVIINTLIDIPYGISGWTYIKAGGSLVLHASGDGVVGGISTWENVDLSLGGYTWTYENPGDLVDNLLVATQDDIWMKSLGYWTPNWWTTTLSQRAFQSPPMFAKLPSLGRLYIIAGNSISYLQKEYNYVIPYQDVNQILEGDEVQWVAHDDFNIYIGSYNSSSGKSGVWVYQPLATSDDTGDIRFFDMNADYLGAGNGWVYKNILYILHPDGSMKAFNGTSFDTVAYTPAYKKNVEFQVHRHGIWIEGRSFLFLTAGVANAYAAGIWKYDIDTKNFYHYRLLVTRKHIAAELDQMGELVLTSAGAFWFNGTEYLAGIVARDGWSSGTYDFAEIMDSTNRFSVPENFGGWFASPKIVFSNISLALATLWTKYVLGANETIDLKFRSRVYAQGTPGGRDEDEVTWQIYVPPVGPGQDMIMFNCTADLSEVRIGDEVTITHGTNAGLSAHVADIYFASGYYTVLLDEAIGRYGPNTSYVTWRTWQRIRTLDKTALQSADTTIPFGDQPAEWVQFKMKLNGENLSIKDYRLTTQETVV